MMPWWAAYVGLPFAHDGLGPDGYHCWGLVRQVYRDQLNVDLPEYGEISSRDLIAAARRIDTDQSSDRWQTVVFPSEFDVVLMRLPAGRRIAHVGVMVNDDHMLHIERASAAVVVPLGHYSVKGRIEGYRRYQPCPS